MSGKTNEGNNKMLSKDPVDSPSIDERNLKKGPWTSVEDAILVEYVRKHGKGNWNAVQKNSGLSWCEKSCCLRWANHLKPNLKKGAFTHEEEKLIIELHEKMGNKWAQMTAYEEIVMSHDDSKYLLMLPNPQDEKAKWISYSQDENLV